jgi:hypothetical protein
MRNIPFFMGAMSLILLSSSCTTQPAETMISSESENQVNISSHDAFQASQVHESVDSNVTEGDNNLVSNERTSSDTTSGHAKKTEQANSEKLQIAQDFPSDEPLFQSPNFKTGGKIVPGRYACQEMPGMQIKSLSEMGTFQRSTTRWTSQFDIVDGESYTYNGSKPLKGKYKYNAKSGTIIWTSGPYSSEPDEEDTITGIYTTRSSDGHPVIIQVFRSPAYGESCEYCALVPK